METYDRLLKEMKDLLDELSEVGRRAEAELPPDLFSRFCDECDQYVADATPP